MKRIASFVLSTFIPAMVFAADVGDTMPALTIDNKGEVILDANNELAYTTWQSSKLDSQNQVQIVQYMAARPSSESDANLFGDALKAAGLAKDLYHLTSVINVSDVPFGMSGMAISEIGKNKITHPHTSFVIDYNGEGLKVLDLQPRSMNLFVLDAEGKVIFTNRNKLTENDVDQAVTLIQQEVAKRQGSPKERLSEIP